MSGTEKRSAHRLLQAPWSGMTLPGLAQGGATLRPDAPAIVEPDNTEQLTGRPARLISCRALTAEVDLLAQKLRALGLKAGDVVLLCLPNTSEAIFALLAVQKAGAIPAPVGVFETVEAIAAAVARVDAAAILTLSHFAGLSPAQACRDAAVAHLSVRFVAAFGNAVPEGVAALDSWETVEFLNAAPFPKIDGPSTALITFDTQAGGLRALSRTHEQLVAEAAAAAALVRVAAGSRLLATIPPASAAGVIFGVALPLLTGAWIELNALFDSAAFAAQLGAGDKTTVILPAAASAAYLRFRGTRAIRSENLVLIHRPQPGEVLVPTDMPDKTLRIVDVLCLGEAVALSSVRAPASALGRLPQRPAYPASRVLKQDVPALALGVDEAGFLMLDGALVPRDAATGNAPLATGFSASLDETCTLHLCSGTVEPSASAAA